MYDCFDANGRRHRRYASTKAAAEQLREEKNVAARKAPQLHGTLSRRLAIKRGNGSTNKQART
jgi:hypothetical protein